MVGVEFYGPGQTNPRPPTLYHLPSGYQFWQAFAGGYDQPQPYGPYGVGRAIATGKGITLSQITDGMSNTALLGVGMGSVKNASDPKTQLSWLSPGWSLVTPAGIRERTSAPIEVNDPYRQGWGSKNGQTHVALADGSVRLMTVNQELMIKLSTIGGGEIVDGDY
jgi:hypothetical protein